MNAAAQRFQQQVAALLRAFDQQVELLLRSVARLDEPPRADAKQPPARDRPAATVAQTTAAAAPASVVPASAARAQTLLLPQQRAVLGHLVERQQVRPIMERLLELLAEAKQSSPWNHLLWAFGALHPQDGPLGLTRRFQGLRTLIDFWSADKGASPTVWQALSSIARFARDHGQHLSDEHLSVLAQGKTASVHLAAPQVASLLAYSFFCLYTGRPSDGPPQSYKSGRWPLANWDELFAEATEPGAARAKAQCLLHYFYEADVEAGGDAQASRSPRTVTVHRRVLDAQQAGRLLTLAALRDDRTALSTWSQEPLGVTIEDAAQPHDLMVDFANAYPGGAVLTHGAVQEEILFCIFPECLVSLLLCERLADNETLAICGARRFSDYRGYHDRFEYAGPHRPRQPLEAEWTSDGRHRRLPTAFAVMDARSFGGQPAAVQWADANVERELVKAYCGFSTPDAVLGGAPGRRIVTGHWGCGAFAGKARLKAAIQWLAASKARRALHYCPMDDKTGPGLDSLQFMQDVVSKWQGRGTVRDLVAWIRAEQQQFASGSQSAHPATSASASAPVRRADETKAERPTPFVDLDRTEDPVFGWIHHHITSRDWWDDAEQAAEQGTKGMQDDYKWLEYADNGCPYPSLALFLHRQGRGGLEQVNRMIADGVLPEPTENGWFRYSQVKQAVEKWEAAEHSKRQQPAPAAAPVSARQVKYASRLAELQHLGYKDDEMLLELLEAANGNAQQVITWLTNAPPSSSSSSAAPLASAEAKPERIASLQRMDVP